MTGTEVVYQALSLLGYAENNGNLQLTQRVMNSVLPNVNLVYGDLRNAYGLKHKRLSNLSQQLELPDKALDIFACGLAGYIAQSEGDSEGQAFWSVEYQSRRTTLSHLTEYKDVLPTVY